MSIDITATIDKLTDRQQRTLFEAAVLSDGRILVPAYSVPDHLTSPYSVQRAALNRIGERVWRAVRARFREEEGNG